MKSSCYGIIEHAKHFLFRVLKSNLIERFGVVIASNKINFLMPMLTNPNRWLKPPIPFAAHSSHCLVGIGLTVEN